MVKFLPKIAKVLLAGTYCLAVLTGCSHNYQPAPQETESKTQTVADSSETDVQTAVDSSETIADAQGSVTEMYKPSDFTIPSLDQYEEPYAGMNFVLPDSIKEKMEGKEVAMLSDSQKLEKEDAIGYVLFTWNHMTKEQKEAAIETNENGFAEWADGLKRMGVLGVYHSSQLGELDKLTKCTEHKKLGTSKDGTYTYYLSIAPDTDQEFAAALAEIALEITDIQPLAEDQGFEANGTLEPFSVQDLDGRKYTNEMFQDKQLTMINVFTTWCSPCVNEIPDLEKLHTEMADQGVNIVGIVLDATDENGNINEETVKTAKLLRERTKATYPFLIPDAGLLGGKLKDIDAVPQTFFVDAKGNIVGETYTGSHSYDDWKEIILAELGSVKGERK